ncbi:MAG: hypothetical protein RR131_10000 [Anaerovorax sp.]
MKKKRRKHPMSGLTALALTIVVLGGIGVGYHVMVATSAFFSSKVTTVSQGQISQTKGSEKKSSLTQSSKSAVQPAKQSNQASAQDWNLVLVNGAHPMKEGYPFYQSCGFVPSHRIKNFFIDHYHHPIFEDGKQLVCRIYLSKDLCAKCIV